MAARQAAVLEPCAAWMGCCCSCRAGGSVPHSGAGGAGVRHTAKYSQLRRTASYSEIQRNTAEFHTACHTALSRMPRQRRVAWMCPSRSTCCHGCWVSPNTFSDPVFAHRDAIRMCLSAPFGAIQQEHHTAYHTAVLLHTCDTHRHAFPPAPYSHTAPYSAIQRHTALYEHTAIQHHTAYSPYNTPLPKNSILGSK